jgi:LysR family transcriptional regulator, nitrogen assimilation regulatory protein
VHWTLALVAAAEPAEPEVIGPVSALLRRVTREAAKAGWPARTLATAARA